MTVRKGDVSPSPGTSSGDDLRGKGIVLAIMILLAAGTGFFALLGYRVIKSQEDTRDSIESLVPPVAETEMVSESAPVVVTDAGEARPEGDAVDKSTLALSVLNGGASKGAAGTAAGVLVKAGFTKAVAGNAEGDYSGVTVYHSDQEAAAVAVKSALDATYKDIRISVADTSKPETKTASVTVILGKE